MKIAKYLFALTALAVAASSQAQTAPSTLIENFDSVAGLTGWTQLNLSTDRGGSYFQGNSDSFVAHSGAANSYIGANFLSAVGGVGTIDNWLISPLLSVNGNTQLSFFTRTEVAGYGDQLEVRFSAGDGTAVSGFTTLLTTVGDSSAYPDGGWQQFVAALPSATGTGRFAFRYTVADALNANSIGIDSVAVSAVPEPSTYAMMGLGLLALTLRRRKAAADKA